MANTLSQLVSSLHRCPACDNNLDTTVNPLVCHCGYQTSSGNIELVARVSKLLTLYLQQKKITDIWVNKVRFSAAECMRPDGLLWLFVMRASMLAKQLDFSPELFAFTVESDKHALLQRRVKSLHQDFNITSYLLLTYAVDEAVALTKTDKSRKFYNSEMSLDTYTPLIDDTANFSLQAHSPLLAAH